MSLTPSKFDRLPKPLATVRDFNAAKGIFIFLFISLLYFAHAAFVPVALALLAALILSSPVEALHRLRVARGLSALLILVVALAAVAGLIALVWTPVQQWYAAAPHTLALIQRRITPLARLIEHLQELTQRAGAVGLTKPAVPEPTVALASGTSVPTSLIKALGGSTLDFATFLVITLFLLTGGPPMVARMTAAFFDHLKANHVQNFIEKVRAEVGHFYVISAVINFGFGIAVAVLMMAWNMPTPYLWGAIAALLNFIPYAGSAATLLLITVVAIISFDGLGHAAGVSLSYVALSTLVGQVVQPLLVGRRLEVNPLLIFLGLWFGGFFWGIAGVILATPSLVALKVIAENAIDGKSMMKFLGPNTNGTSRVLKVAEFPAKETAAQVSTAKS